MNGTFIAYVDEAGQEGGEHGRGASEWFVLGAIVIRASNNAEIERRLVSFKREYKKADDWRFKFSGLDPKRKIRVCQTIAQMPCRLAAIAVHKPSLRDEKLKADHKRLYFYYGKFLMERVSWICRDHGSGAIGGNGKIDFVFSERRNYPYDKIQDYVRRLPFTDEKSQAAWSFIDPDMICSMPHHDAAGCVFADAVASAAALALEYTEFDITDSRPIVALQQCFYRPANGGYQNNGLKLFPNEANALIPADPRLEWARTHFGFR